MLKYEYICGIKPSFTEKIISQELDKRNIVYVQEVVFEECKNPQTGLHLRFDFYLPVQNILIEYDGKDYHADVEAKRRDKIKNKFAKENKIKLYRISGVSNIYAFMHRKFGEKVKKVVYAKDDGEKAFLANRKAKGKKKAQFRQATKEVTKRLGSKTKKSQSEIRELLSKKANIESESQINRQFKVSIDENDNSYPPPKKKGFEIKYRKGITYK